jgi:transcriptional regulator with XRE-family HTH domain
MIRRVRRIADLSQADLAHRLGVTPSAVARWESGAKQPNLVRLQEVLAVAGLRLAVTDDHGSHVPPMRSDAVRDMAGRRFPAHLDVRPTDETPDHRGIKKPQLGTAPGRWWRDWHRAKTDDGDRHTDDHVTEAEVHVARQALREHWSERAKQRRHEAEEARRAKGLPWMIPTCFCIDDCYLDRYCPAACPCQCDAAPGWDWGDTCSLRSGPPTSKGQDTGPPRCGILLTHWAAESQADATMTKN